MNSVKYSSLVLRLKKSHRARIALYLFTLFTVSIYISGSGCSDKVSLPSTQQLIEFENAGPPRPIVDMDRIVRAQVSSVPYRVIHDEVLELTMPSILRTVTTEEFIRVEQDAKFTCRISERGTITLPVVGEIEVAGKTLAQIESVIIDKYYPEYVLTPPSVFAKVLEYKTSKVSISGAVQTPGIYSLRSDQMSLVALIMEAGGIIDEGAALIRIIHSEDMARHDHIDTTKETHAKAIQHTIEDFTEPINAETKLSPDYPSSNKINVQLSFRQPSAQSSTGVITVIHEKEVLLSEKIDISSEIERMALLKLLSWKEPRVSTTDVAQKLYTLAGQINSKSGRSGNVNTSMNVNRKSIQKIDNTEDKSRILRKKNDEQKPKIVRTNAAQWPKIMPELFQPIYDIHSNIDIKLNNNIYSNTAFNANNLKQNTTTHKEINKELREILDIVTNPKNGRKDTLDENREPETLVLPVKGYNIPFVDVALQDGDTVIVDRLEQPLFSVIGLVNRPGNFPYPPNVQYNLMRAIAFAGGLDSAAEPHYATIYRLKQNGMIVNATFEIVHIGNSSQLTDALDTRIKPGDIVSVEHTPRTRTNVFLDRVFRINMGTYFNLSDVWDE